jgi:hypothetical protein
MSEPKIAINIPSQTPTGSPTTPGAKPGAPSGSGLPSKPASPPPPASPEEGSALAGMFKFGFVILLVVAAFFIYRSITLQSQLTQLRNENTQALEQAKADVAKAQTDLQGLTEDKVKLLAQVDKATGESADAKASAEKASVEAARMRAQLTQARTDAIDAKASADKASAEVARLQAQLQALLQAQASAQAQPQLKPAVAETAQAKTPAAASREMPVLVSFRKAVVGDANSLVIQNISSNALPVTVKFSNTVSSRSKEYRLALDAGATKELGSLGAWILSSGDRVEIGSPDYNSIVKTAP